MLEQISWIFEKVLDFYKDSYIKINSYLKEKYFNCIYSDVVENIDSYKSTLTKLSKLLIIFPINILFINSNAIVLYIGYFAMTVVTSIILICVLVISIIPLFLFHIVINIGLIVINLF